MDLCGRSFEFFEVGSSKLMVAEIRPAEVPIVFKDKTFYSTKWMNYSIWQEVLKLISAILEGYDSRSSILNKSYLQKKSGVAVTIGYQFNEYRENPSVQLSPRKDVSSYNPGLGSYCRDSPYEMVDHSLLICVYPLKLKLDTIELAPYHSTGVTYIESELCQVMRGCTTGYPSSQQSQKQRASSSSTISSSMSATGKKLTSCFDTGSDDGSEASLAFLQTRLKLASGDSLEMRCAEENVLVESYSNVKGRKNKVSLSSSSPTIDEIEKSVRNDEFDTKTSGRYPLRKRRKRNESPVLSSKAKYHPHVKEKESSNNNHIDSKISNLNSVELDDFHCSKRERKSRKSEYQDHNSESITNSKVSIHPAYSCSESRLDLPDLEVRRERIRDDFKEPSSSSSSKNPLKFPSKSSFGSPEKKSRSKPPEQKNSITSKMKHPSSELDTDDLETPDDSQLLLPDVMDRSVLNATTHDETDLSPCFDDSQLLLPDVIDRSLLSKLSAPKSSPTGIEESHATQVKPKKRLFSPQCKMKKAIDDSNSVSLFDSDVKNDIPSKSKNIPCNLKAARLFDSDKTSVHSLRSYKTKHSTKLKVKSHVKGKDKTKNLKANVNTLEKYFDCSNSKRKDKKSTYVEHDSKSIMSKKDFNSSGSSLSSTHASKSRLELTSREIDSLLPDLELTPELITDDFSEPANKSSSNSKHKNCFVYPSTSETEKISRRKTKKQKNSNTPKKRHPSSDLDTPLSQLMLPDLMDRSISVLKPKTKKQKSLSKSRTRHSSSDVDTNELPILEESQLLLPDVMDRSLLNFLSSSKTRHPSSDTDTNDLETPEDSQFLLPDVIDRSLLSKLTGGNSSLEGLENIPSTQISREKQSSPTGQIKKKATKTNLKLQIRNPYDPFPTDTSDKILHAGEHQKGKKLSTGSLSDFDLGAGLPNPETSKTQSRLPNRRKAKAKNALTRFRKANSIENEESETRTSKKRKPLKGKIKSLFNCSSDSSDSSICNVPNRNKTVERKRKTVKASGSGNGNGSVSVNEMCNKGASKKAEGRGKDKPTKSSSPSKTHDSSESSDSALSLEYSEINRKRNTSARRISTSSQSHSISAQNFLQASQPINNSPYDAAFLQTINEEFNKLSLQDFERYFHQNLDDFVEIIRGRCPCDRDKRFLKMPNLPREFTGNTFFSLFGEDMYEELAFMVSEELKDCMKEARRSIPVTLYSVAVLVPELLKRILLSFPVAQRKGVLTEEDGEEVFYQLTMNSSLRPLDL